MTLQKIDRHPRYWVPRDVKEFAFFVLDLPRRPLNDRAAKLKSARALSCSIRDGGPAALDIGIGEEGVSLV